MKRVLHLMTLWLLMLVCLTGCIVIPRHKTFEISPDTVSTIKIYDLRGRESRFEGAVDADAPVYELPEEEKTDFLTELAKVDFSDEILIMLAAVDPSFSFGEWVVRINYADGSYEFLSCNAFGSVFNQNDELISTHHYGSKREEWIAFLGNYAPKNFFDE